MNENILKGLNAQLKLEAESSNIYLSMASWADFKGYEGVSEFLYTHADEERQHFLKLVHYINERGGVVTIPGLSAPSSDFKSIQDIFESILNHERKVTESINELVGLTLKEKDHITHNFLQWYVAEQIEEEKLAQYNVDKLNLIGKDKSGMYLFDRDIKNSHQEVQ